MRRHDITAFSAAPALENEPRDASMPAATAISSARAACAPLTMRWFPRAWSRQLVMPPAYLSLHGASFTKCRRFTAAVCTHIDARDAGAL